MIISSYLKAISCIVALCFVFSTVHADQYIEGYNSAREGNYSIAFEKWQPLARNGDARALFSLGLMYHAGLYVESDERAAVKLYQMAAEIGHYEAQEFLVIGYEEGWFGLPRDEDAAIFWKTQLDL